MLSISNSLEDKFHIKTIVPEPAVLFPNECPDSYFQCHNPKELTPQGLDMYPCNTKI